MVRWREHDATGQAKKALLIACSQGTIGASDGGFPRDFDA